MPSTEGNPLSYPKYDASLESLKERSGCLPDAMGRRPMGCHHDGWSHPSPYASLSQDDTEPAGEDKKEPEAKEEGEEPRCK